MPCTVSISVFGAPTALSLFRRPFMWALTVSSSGGLFIDQRDSRINARLNTRRPLRMSSSKIEISFGVYLRGCLS